MQKYYDELEQWSAQKFMRVNATKTKELIISNKYDRVRHLCDQKSQVIEKVEHFKLLGVVLHKIQLGIIMLTLLYLRPYHIFSF